jgi:TorA maturation chaperone TorD
MNAQADPIATSDAELARECLYRVLAAVVGGPFAPGWDDVLAETDHDLVLGAADLLATDGGPDIADWSRLIESLRVPPETLRDQYDRVFGLIAPKECPPYETEYYPTAETFARSQQLADLAGFYRAFGLETSQRSPERPDHLALELEFLAFLLLKRREAMARIEDDPKAAEHAEVCDAALRDFVRDHLAWWVPAFAAGLRRKAQGLGYPAALAAVLAAWIPAECRRLGIEAVLRPARPDLIEKPEEQDGCASCPLHG